MDDVDHDLDVPVAEPSDASISTMQACQRVTPAEAVKFLAMIAFCKSILSDQARAEREATQHPRHWSVQHRLDYYDHAVSACGWIESIVKALTTE